VAFPPKIPRFRLLDTVGFTPTSVQEVVTRAPYRYAVVRREALSWNESILLGVYRHLMSRWG
jgi:hypothetical protein